MRLQFCIILLIQSSRHQSSPPARQRQVCDSALWKVITYIKSLSFRGAIFHANVVVPVPPTMFSLWAIPVVLFLLPVVAYLVLRWQNRRFDRISEELPGPKSLPLIGCGYLFFGKTNEEQFSIVNDITKQYPSPCRAWLGPKFLVFIDNPEDLQVVLNSPNCLEKAFVYRFFRCETGLFSAPANVWKVHRKLLSPCFSPQILASFVNIFNEKSSVMVQRISHNLDRGAFDIYGDVSRCTLDLICGKVVTTV